MKRCKKVKRAHTGNIMNTSVGIQNRVTIWRTVDSERDTIEESTSVCLVGGGLKHGMSVHYQLQRLSTWRARVKTSIEVPVGSVLPASHANP